MPAHVGIVPSRPHPAPLADRGRRGRARWRCDANDGGGAGADRRAISRRENKATPRASSPLRQPPACVRRAVELSAWAGREAVSVVAAKEKPSTSGGARNNVVGLHAPSSSHTAERSERASDHRSVIARAFASRRWWFLAGVSNTVGDKELEAIDALHASITNDVLAAPRSPVQTSIDSMEDSVDGEDRGGGVVVNEFRDASGNAFQVALSNEDAPAGMTKLEMRGMDRDNLLGSLCSALARVNISIVSGIISTGDDGRVRNTMFVRKQLSALPEIAASDGDPSAPGPNTAATNTIVAPITIDEMNNITRVPESEFSAVSLRVLSACWTSDRREWLKTRQAGKFLGSAYDRGSLGDGAGGGDVAAAEAKMRAVSARLADSAARVAMTRDAWSKTDVVEDDLLAEMEGAMKELTRARKAQRKREKKMAARALMKGPGAKKDESGFTTDSGSVLSSAFVRGVMAMNLAAVLFGSNQVVIKQVADAGCDDFTQLFFRFVFAVIPLVPFLAEGLESKDRDKLLQNALEVGTVLCVGYILQIIGLDGTTSSRGALTSTFTVLTVPIFAQMSGQVVPWYTWPASAIGIVGVGLLTNSGGEPVVGDAICILSATVFGYHTLRSAESAVMFEDLELPFIAWQIAVVCVEAGACKLLSMIYHAHEQGIDATAVFAALPDELAATPWAPIAYMGLFTTSFTLLIEFYALQNISAATAALVYTAEPLWGAAFAWWFMGDRWGPIGWVGSALIIGSSVGSQLLSFDEVKKAKALEAANDALIGADAARSR